MVTDRYSRRHLPAEVSDLASRMLCPMHTELPPYKLDMRLSKEGIAQYAFTG